LRETLPVRFWIEILIGSVALALFLLTLVWPDWIEIGFGWDPDNHNGAVEWSIAGVLLMHQDRASPAVLQSRGLSRSALLSPQPRHQTDRTGGAADHA
jgi:hypothetical protein